jgi:hypothetical protein
VGLVVPLQPTAACGLARTLAEPPRMPVDTTSLGLALSRVLRCGAPEIGKLATCLVSQAQAEYAMPVQIGDCTDFYTSVHHATNVGRLFRPGNPSPPNYKWLPTGYHGRASTIGGMARPSRVLSGRQWRRERKPRISVRPSVSTTNSKSACTSGSGLPWSAADLRSVHVELSNQLPSPSTGNECYLTQDRKFYPCIESVIVADIISHGC